MKRIVSGTLLCAMLTACFWGELVSAQTYTDVSENHWAYDCVERCTAKNWFSGYPDNTFRPDNSMTRAEALKVFVSFLGLSLSPVTNSTYYDVSPAEWYAPYIEAGKELFPKQTSLDGQLKFQPEMPVNREDVIYAIVFAAGFNEDAKFADQSILNMFCDLNSISERVLPYAAVAVTNGLVSGYDDGRIGGQDPLTRAEFAALLYRASFVGSKRDAIVVPTDVTIAPDITHEVNVGESFVITSIMTYSNGATEDYSDSINPYEDDESGILSFNKNKVTALKSGTAIVKFNDTHLADKNLVVIVHDNSQAPTISITDYEPVSYKGTSNIVGKVTDETGTFLTITCNDKTLMINSDGSFSYSAKLSKGVNEFTFSAVNGHDKKTEKSVSIFRQDEIPTPTPTIKAILPTETIPPEPTKRPTPSPIEKATESPTLPPTKAPTLPPTKAPTLPPTKAPTETPTDKPAPYTIKKPTSQPSDEPTKEAIIEEKSEQPRLVANVESFPTDSNPYVGFSIRYSGLLTGSITSVQFVLEFDDSKYTYDNSSSKAYFGGAQAYQRSKGGLRYVFASSDAISSTSGKLSNVFLKVNSADCSDFDTNDFSLFCQKFVNNGTAYDNVETSVSD